MDDLSIFSELTGTALAIAVLIFFIHYFMRKEQQRERFITHTIQYNTKVLRRLIELIVETKGCSISEKQRILEELDPIKDRPLD